MDTTKSPLFTMRDTNANLVAGLESVGGENALIQKIAWDRALTSMAVGDLAHGADTRGVRYVLERVR